MDRSTAPTTPSRFGIGRTLGRPWLTPRDPDPARRRPQLVAPRGARRPEFAGEPAPAAHRGHHRRRRDPGRRLHGDVDRVPPEAARPRRRRRAPGAGHLRRRAQRPQRRVREQLLERPAALVAEFGDEAASALCRSGRGERGRDRRLLRRARRRRLVPQRRRPQRGRLRRAGGGLGRPDHHRRPPGPRPRTSRSWGRRRSGRWVDSPTFQGGVFTKYGATRAAGPPGARAPARADGPGRAHLRADPGHAVRLGVARDRRDPGRHGARGRRRDRRSTRGPAIGSGSAAPSPCAAATSC